MTVKEYLDQAFRLDQRINSKVEQVASLNTLATKCTTVLTGMPRNPSHSVSSTADIVEKIVDLKVEINKDIDRLVDLKREIVQVIKSVTDSEFQTLLELRYLCFKPWEQIAVEMGYDLRYVFKLHGRALEQCEPRILENWTVKDTD